MTLIANPIYDAVFKYLMEDEKVATLLLSALLKKEIVELHMRQHEFSNPERTKISMFRIDFSARVKEPNGETHLVLIELQKTWLPTETLRFRQYLGVNYLNKENMGKEPDDRFGLPIITIYILGHTLGELKEPVIYVRRSYLDYDDHIINQKDKFIESLTHDSVIVQVPYLQKRTRNRLERLLSIFNQNNRYPNNSQLLEIDDSIFHPEEQTVITRLLKAGVAPDVRRHMDIEDEMLYEIETRDTLLMRKDQMIEQKDLAIEQKDQMIEQKDLAIEQKDQVIEQKDLAIEQKERLLKESIHLLSSLGLTGEEIARKLDISGEEIKRYTSNK